MQERTSERPSADERHQLLICRSQVLALSRKVDGRAEAMPEGKLSRHAHRDCASHTLWWYIEEGLIVHSSGLARGWSARGRTKQSTNGEIHMSDTNDTNEKHADGKAERRHYLDELKRVQEEAVEADKVHSCPRSH